jgi:hypothetical protein
LTYKWKTALTHSKLVCQYLRFYGPKKITFFAEKLNHVFCLEEATDKTKSAIVRLIDRSYIKVLSVGGGKEKANQDLEDAPLPKKAKRGRGRPSKAAYSSEEDGSPQPKKGRGRPSAKAGSAKKPTPKEEAPPPKKAKGGRGRPKKVSVTACTQRRGKLDRIRVLFFSSSNTLISQSEYWKI